MLGRPETALAGGREERDWDRERADLTARLKAAWGASRDTGVSAGDNGQERERDPEPEPDQEARQEDLASRLRSAAEGIDRDALGGRAAELRETREADDREREAELAKQRELERQKVVERELEARAAAARSRGLGREL